ncbi:hypothetical protein CCZ01_08020 [Helicobacter monodelphidis]|uniref:FixH family protein n=1 Tax=Helicobacter sp. 15-1451 TaxID=2004995 RepID=UPI000DCD2D7E|nr:FixH family protein [Helicobacter sp. 15-1451]RAX56877.1 hypothetical protein CCZ01_08020 [Helicobacter sp. 15-1451]
MDKNQFNVWPIAIVLFVCVVIVLIVVTVQIALKNPVQLEDSFLMSYQEADASINDIQKEQKQFLEHYQVHFELPKQQSLEFSQGISFVLIQRDNQKKLVDAKILKAILTRPHTSRDDKDLEFYAQNQHYQSEAFILPDYGRWIVQGVLEIDGKKGYFKHSFFVEKL